MTEKEVVLSTEEFNALPVDTRERWEVTRNEFIRRGKSFRFRDGRIWFLCDVQSDQNPPYQVYKIKIRDRPETNEIAAMPSLCPRCVSLLEERDRLSKEVELYRKRLRGCAREAGFDPDVWLRP